MGLVGEAARRVSSMTPTTPMVKPFWNSLKSATQSPGVLLGIEVP